MLDVLKNLAANYALSATPFFIAHLLLLAYFFRRWVRSRGLIERDLKKLRGGKDVPELLSEAQEQILKYAAQSREADLPRLERAATDKVFRHLEVGRLLVNSFVVVGLMGTLFALFDVGQDAGTLKGPQDVLSRMSVAFSASFFGLLWALVCNLFFLRSLRRWATQAAQEVGRRLSEFSGANPPESPALALGQAALSFRQNAEAIGQVIARQERREKAALRASNQLLRDFRDTTRKVIEDLAKEVKDAQEKSATTVGDLKTGITSSLDDIKKRFVEISTNWRADINKTVKASEGAAERLAKASESLASATGEVSASLRAVQLALERTKALAEIVTGVEALTKAYLERTGEQMDIFGKGLNVTLDAARSIPDEWFTMLGKRNSELSEGLAKVVEAWQGHVTGTAEELATRFEKVGGDVAALHELLSPEGRLAETIGQIQETVRLTNEWVDYKSRADVNVQLDALVSAVEKLDDTVGRLSTVSDGAPGASPIIPPDGLHDLPHMVEDIKKLLGELVSHNGLRAEKEAEEAGDLSAPVLGESDGSLDRTLSRMEEAPQAPEPNQSIGITDVLGPQDLGEAPPGEAEAARSNEQVSPPDSHKTSAAATEDSAVTPEDSAHARTREAVISAAEEWSVAPSRGADAISATEVAAAAEESAAAAVEESAPSSSEDVGAAPPTVAAAESAEVGDASQEEGAVATEDADNLPPPLPPDGRGFRNWLKRKVWRRKG